MKARQFLLVMMLLIFSVAHSQYSRLHLSASVGPAVPIGGISHVGELDPDVRTTSGSSFNLGVDFDISDRFGASLYLAGDFFEVEDSGNDGIIYDDWVASWAMLGGYFHHSWNRRLRVQTGLQLGLMGIQTPRKIEPIIDTSGVKFRESYERSDNALGVGVQGKMTFYSLKFLGVFINTQVMHGAPKMSYGKQSFTSARFELGLETRFIK